MNNFQRAQFLARRALASIDDFDVRDVFTADRLSGVDTDQVIAYLRRFEDRIAEGEL